MFLTTLAIAGCSNDDDLIDKGKEGQENGQLRYLAVNIVTPKDPGVRSATDEDFVQGSEAEDAAEKATFVLLDNNDDVVSVLADQPLNPWKGLGNYNPNVENVSTAVLVVKAEKSQPAVNGILAILNAPSGLNIAKEGDNMKTTLAGIKEIAGNYGPSGDKGSFIMTNSVYVDGTDIKIAADVTDAQFAKTEDAAKNNPVDIYVERVVAKITTSAVANIIDQGSDKFNRGASVRIDGERELTDLTINIKGIQIANSAQWSYLFKNVDGFQTFAPWSEWNDLSNYRSYWANMPTSGVTYMNHSWNQISGQDDGNTALALTASHSFYVQENVVPTASTADPKQHTSVIVTAQLQNNEGTPFEFVQIGGVYYTPDDGLEQIAGYLANRHYYIQKTSGEGDNTTTTYESIPVDYLKWAETAPTDATDVKGWEGFAQLTEEHANEQFYIYDANYSDETAPYKPCDDFNNVGTVLKTDKALRALKWTDGMCYYFVDIEHFGTETTGEGDAATTVQRKGIIRNHVYNLTLNSLEGLGVPVFDPEKEIIPENPPKNELFYLAARVNILKWKIVGQEINFNN